jgi:hypothetical protein
MVHCTHKQGVTVWRSFSGNARTQITTRATSVIDYE